jgi:hypothetical protein
MKIKNEAGEEIEVFSAEEVAQKVQDATAGKAPEIETAVAGVKAEYEGKLSPLQTLETETLDLEAKRAGGDDKGQQGNFKELKKALDEKTSLIDGLKNSIDEMKKGQITQTRDTIVKGFAGNDAELAKTIKDHYDTTLSGMPEATPADIAKRVEAAAKLASNGEAFDPLGVARQGGGGFGQGGTQYDGDKNDFSPNEKALGAKLGITDADYKKYGPKTSKK